MGKCVVKVRTVEFTVRRVESLGLFSNGPTFPLSRFFFLLLCASKMFTDGNNQFQCAFG